MKLLLLLVLGLLTASRVVAQGRESWVPDTWTGPTAAPIPGTNRVALYRCDSARTALLDLSRILEQQGFKVSLLNGRQLQAYRNLPDSLHLKEGAGIRITAATALDFPCTLVLHAKGISNLRRLHGLSGPSTAHPAGRKVYYPGEEGEHAGSPRALPHVVFDCLLTIATAYSTVRVTFLTTH